MAGSKGIRRNSGLVLLGQVVRMAGTALVFVIVARAYGPLEFGSYAAAHTLTTIFLLLADFGFDILLTWEIGRRQDEVRLVVSRYLSAKLVLSAVATLGMAVTGMLLDVSPMTQTLMLVLSGSVFFSAVANFFIAIFRGLERFQYETWISLASNVLLLLATGAAALLSAPLWLVGLIFVAGRALAALMASVVGVRTASVQRLEWHLPGPVELRRIGVFGAHAVFATLFFTQDTILLALWKGDASVGVYQAAFKLVGLLFLIPDVLMTAAFPSLAKAYEDDRPRWTRTGLLLQKTLVSIGVSASLVLLAAPDLVITGVYGSTGFGESVGILQIFSAAVVVHCATIGFALLLTTSGRHAVRMYIVTGATALNLALNAVLIPAHGTTGAAIASVSTLLVVGAAYVMPLRSLFRAWVSEPRVIITLGAAVALAIATMAARVAVGWPALPVAFIVSGALMWYTFAPGEREAMLGRDLAGFRPSSGPRP